MTKIISTKRILLMSGAVCALSFFGGSTWAADAAASADTTAPTIGEIVVTAERREENLQDTPIAVSAFSADTLNGEKLNGGEDLLLQVPNTNFTRSNFGGYDFKIRGIGTDVIASGVSGTAGVSINLNEMPVTANHFQDEEFYDVDRVEVLRGPQGTLYGRNATGGLVTNVTCGSATAVVIHTGDSTYLGSVAESLAGKRALTSFEKGIRGVSLLLLRFMLVMTVIVFFINGITKHDWKEAFFFALAIAVGLTPRCCP